MAKKSTKHQEEAATRGHANGEANGHANGEAKTDPAPAPDAKTAIPGGAVERKKYTEPLQCKLDEADLTKLRERLTAITVSRFGKEAEIAYLRDEVKGLKEREGKLVGELERASEERPVECIEYLLPTNEIMVVRTDTSEVVETRAATADELQEPMFDEGAQPEGEDAQLDFEGEVAGEIDNPDAILPEGA